MVRVPAGYYLPPDADYVAPTPKKRAKRGNVEAGIQVAIVKFLRLALPGAVIHASPNGAVLAGNSEGRAIAMAKLKAAGMLVGWPDLIVVWADRSGRAHVFAFEVKQEGGKVSPAQAEVGAMIERNGGRWAVVRSVTEAEDAIREWKGDLP